VWDKYAALIFMMHNCMILVQMIHVGLLGSDFELIDEPVLWFLTSHAVCN
jgi:hypothetical protein